MLRVLHGLLASCTTASAGDDGNGDDEDDEDASDDTEAPVQPTVVTAQRKELKDWRTLVVRMAEASAQFVGAEDGHVVQSAFAVLIRATASLRNSTRVLFPLLHRVWPAVVPRLRVGPLHSQHHKIAVAATVDFVCQLMTTWACADFLRSRFTETVWPPLRDMLQRGCPWAQQTVLHRAALQFTASSAAESTAIIASLSMEDRVLERVLIMFASVAREPQNCGMLRGILWQLCCAALPYLASVAAPQLQQAAIHVFEALHAHVDAPAAWLFLHRCSARVATFSPPPSLLSLPAIAIGVDPHSKQPLKWTGYAHLQPSAVAGNVQRLLRQLCG